jgi:hypothetical protein
VGILSNTATGQLHTLDGHTLIGRGPHCTIRLPDLVVSQEHASLTWSKDAWVLRDLNSTNGTWLDGERVPKQADLQLVRGARVAFGDRDAVWEVSDARAPEPMAISTSTNEPSVIDNGVIVLSRAADASVSIHQTADGQWVLEVGDTARPIAPGEVVESNGMSWRFFCPTQWQPTAPLQSVRLVAGSTFIFDVTRDQDRVWLTVDCGRELVPMGESENFYFLHELAKRRAQEQSRRLPAEAGWAHRDQLVRALRCDVSLLNVWVWRIRAKFCEAGFLDYASVIERQNGGRLRIGVSKIVSRTVE